MILDYVIQHLGRLDWSDEARSRVLVRAAASPPPFAVSVEVLHAIAASSFLAAHLGDPDLAPKLAGQVWSEPMWVGALPAAERNRLLAKGRQLYEHCMTELSASCVIGFFHHELQKRREAAGVVGELLGELVQERRRLCELPEDEDDATRSAWTDVMIDHGVSYLFGLSREVADALAWAKEPLV
jgi:hypothetical protein